MEIDARSATLLLLAFASPTRLVILLKLSKSPKCVTDIEDLLQAKPKNLSENLAMLWHTHLVVFARDASARSYYLAKPELSQVLLEEYASNETPVSKSIQQIKLEKVKLEANQSRDSNK